MTTRWNRSLGSRARVDPERTLPLAVQSEEHDDGDQFDKEEAEGGEGRFLDEVDVMGDFLLKMIAREPGVDGEAERRRRAPVVRQSEDDNVT